MASAGISGRTKAASHSYSANGAEKIMLRSFGEFEKHLEPELGKIHNLQRASIIFRAYELAERKFELEMWRASLNLTPRGMQLFNARYRKALTLIRKAIGAINLTETAVGSTKYLGPGVIEARELLQQEETHLSWFLDQCAQAWPLVQHDSRQKNTPAYPLELGVAKIDHWFVGELDKVLDTALTHKRMFGRAGRNRIIAKVFEAAFSVRQEIGKIKMARRRRKRPRPSKATK